MFCGSFYKKNASRSYYDGIKPYEPNRTIGDFRVAGFAYHEGIYVIEELRIGTTLELFAEPDNPYDTNAVAIYYKDVKIGYIPRESNALISKMILFGYKDIFEVKVRRKNLEFHPDRQLEVVIRIKDWRM